MIYILLLSFFFFFVFFFFFFSGVGEVQPYEYELTVVPRQLKKKNLQLVSKSRPIDHGFLFVAFPSGIFFLTC